MDIIDLPLMALFVIVFDTIIINILIQYYLRKYGLGKVAKFAKMYMSHLGEKSQVAQHNARQKIIAKEAKDKMAKAALEEVPLLGRIADRAGVNGEEIFALLQDQEFMKGMGVIVDIGDGLLKRLKGVETKKPENNQPNQQSQFGQPF